MPDDPAPDPEPAVRRCQHCGEASHRVMLDERLAKWLCHWCWSKTPAPGR